MLKSFAFSAGLMLSPDMLTTAGNLAGRMTSLFLLFLGAAAFCHIVTSRVYGMGLKLSHDRAYAGETELIQRALGPGWALLFSFFPRLLFFLFLSTSVLATAGYVFNEVFAYWFPNFGFSLCLLGLLLALNILGKGPADLVQVVFVSVSLLGLLVLALVGFATLDPSGEKIILAYPGRGLLGYMFFPLMIFVGFELAFFSSKGEKPVSFHLRSMLFAILGIGLLLGAWGLASLAHVAPERLSQSTLPHVLAARSIMGQSGRVLIGVVAICGACGAVNVLLASLSRLMQAMAQEGLIPKAMVQVRGRPLMPPCLLCGAVLVMMGAGMAGSPNLFHLNMAGAWFWLASYGVVHLSFLLTREYRSQAWFWRRVIPVLSSGSIFFIVSVLATVFFALQRADALNLLKMVILLLALSVICSVALLRLKP
jgi:amino acid transporter